jgi:hypothetical protein
VTASRTARESSPFAPAGVKWATASGLA